MQLNNWGIVKLRSPLGGAVAAATEEGWKQIEKWKKVGIEAAASVFFGFFIVYSLDQPSSGLRATFPKGKVRFTNPYFRNYI